MVSSEYVKRKTVNLGRNQEHADMVLVTVGFVDLRLDVCAVRAQLVSIKSWTKEVRLLRAYRADGRLHFRVAPANFVCGCEAPCFTTVCKEAAVSAPRESRRGNG